MECFLFFFFDWDVFLNTVYEECSGVSRPSGNRRGGVGMCDRE